MSTLMTASGQRLTVVNRSPAAPPQRTLSEPAAPACNPISSTLAASIVQQLKQHHSYSANLTPEELEQKARTEFYLASVEESRKDRRGQILELLGRMNQKRCDATPIYGEDLRDSICRLGEEPFSDSVPITVRGAYECRQVWRAPSCWSLPNACKSIERRAQEFRAVFANFVCYVPAVCAPAPKLHVSHPSPSRSNAEQDKDTRITDGLRPALRILHPIISAMSTLVSVYVFVYLYSLLKSITPKRFFGLVFAMEPEQNSGTDHPADSAPNREKPLEPCHNCIILVRCSSC